MVHDDVPTRLPEEFLRRDARHPRLEPGEQITLDFHRVAWPGDVVLIHRAGRYILAVAPTTEHVIAVVRVLDR